LVQDAVFPSSEMRWDRKSRRFALLLNRYRWEDRSPSAERVQSVLALEYVTRVQTQGVDPKDKNTVLSLLSVTYEPGLDGAGRVVFTLAGDGAIAAEVEALEAVLRDVTKPYGAPSGQKPTHEE
ncbi:MAG: DUF2948 family protein, partial [Pseudomonadota bacterium]